jgi:hypothetical protein
MWQMSRVGSLSDGTSRTAPPHDMGALKPGHWRLSDFTASDGAADAKDKGAADAKRVRVLQWNCERGLELHGIIQEYANCPLEPSLCLSHPPLRSPALLRSPAAACVTLTPSIICCLLVLRCVLHAAVLCTDWFVCLPTY